MSGFVTTTLTPPGLFAGWTKTGVLAWISVGEIGTTFSAGSPPKVTVATGRKLEPLMVTGVRPLVSPRLGDTELTTGAGA